MMFMSCPPDQMRLRPGQSKYPGFAMASLSREVRSCTSISSGARWPWSPDCSGAVHHVLLSIVDANLSGSDSSDEVRDKDKQAEGEEPAEPAPAEPEPAEPEPVEPSAAEKPADAEPKKKEPDQSDKQKKKKERAEKALAMASSKAKVRPGDRFGDRLAGEI